MRGTGGRPEETSEDEKRAVDSFSKELSRSGSGVALYFDAAFASEYGLDPDTEVEVNVIEKDGDVAFEIENIPAGFTSDELRTFAEEQGWEETDEYVDPDSDEWYLTYRNRDGNVRVEIDSESQINGKVTNNVVIQGRPIDVTSDYDKFGRLCAAAQGKELRVRVNDSKGNWERLKAEPNQDTDDVPDEETFEQLCSAAETVTAQLVCQTTTLTTTLDDLEATVNAIEDAYEGFE